MNITTFTQVIRLCILVAIHESEWCALSLLSELSEVQCVTMKKTFPYETFYDDVNISHYKEC
jgi:hypothetical protein